MHIRSLNHSYLHELIKINIISENESFPHHKQLKRKYKNALRVT